MWTGCSRASSSESSGNRRTRSGSTGTDCVGGGGVLKYRSLSIIEVLSRAWKLTSENEHGRIHLEDKAYQPCANEVVLHTFGMFFVISTVIRWSFRCFRWRSTTMTCRRIFSMSWRKILKQNLHSGENIFFDSNLFMFEGKWWKHMTNLQDPKFDPFLVLSLGLLHRESSNCRVHLWPLVVVYNRIESFEKEDLSTEDRLIHWLFPKVILILECHSKDHHWLEDHNHWLIPMLPYLNWIHQQLERSFRIKLQMPNNVHHHLELMSMARRTTTTSQWIVDKQTNYLSCTYTT